MILRRIAPFSLAKNIAIIYLVGGIILGLTKAVYSIVAESGTQYEDRPLLPILGNAFNVIPLLALPLLNSAIAFISSLIAAVIYNRLSIIVGPIELDLDDPPVRHTHRKTPENNEGV